MPQKRKDLALVHVIRHPINCQLPILVDLPEIFNFNRLLILVLCSPSTVNFLEVLSMRKVILSVRMRFSAIFGSSQTEKRMFGNPILHRDDLVKVKSECQAHNTDNGGTDVVP